MVHLLPCVDAGENSPEVLEMLTTERDRIPAAMAELAAARNALGRMIEHTKLPSPRALTEPPRAGLGAVRSRLEHRGVITAGPGSAAPHSR